MVVLLSFNNFSLCLLSSRKKSPRHHWAKALFKEAMVSPSDFIKRHYNDKHSVLRIPLLDDTIGKFFPLEVFVYIYLPQSLADVMKFAADLSHCAVHRIDVCPYKVA